VPNASGWALDDPVIGHPFLNQVLDVSTAHPEVPPVVATHKGFALPGFDQRSAAPRDVGPAARDFPGVRFIIYHSGYDSGDTQGPYDPTTPDTVNKVDAFITSLRNAGVDAKSNGGNSPNVWAELGSVWRDCMRNPDQAAHLLGKLITWVGPKRIAWGTDSLWYGSPQPEIVALRRFEFTAEGKELYNLPHGLEGDRDDPQVLAATPDRTIRNGILGRNAAEAYAVDADFARNAIACDQVESLRDGYLNDVGTLNESAPMSSNHLLGARTRRELFDSLRGKPWSP
jgi:predicted TIM-barrel fold metal-dependent hydrolase